ASEGESFLHLLCDYCTVVVVYFFFFFFQAEDGIRDRNVTGVQTCALPILYQNIGRRIREFRDSKGYTRQMFVSYFLASLNDDEMGRTSPLSVQSLSNIENVDIVKKRNPYLMSKKQFNLLPKFMGCSQNELVFGDSEEREDTVKLILLSIILNGAKLSKNGKQEFINPFIDIRITENDYKEVVNELK